MEKTGENEWPAQGYLVPKSQNQTSNPGLWPQGLGFSSLRRTSSNSFSWTTRLVQCSCSRPSRWETAQEMSHPPQKSSHLLGGEKQVFSPEQHSTLEQEAKILHWDLFLEAVLVQARMRPGSRIRVSALAEMWPELAWPLKVRIRQQILFLSDICLLEISSIAVTLPRKTH